MQVETPAEHPVLQRQPGGVGQVERLAEANPHPETELESVNDYTLLVAVVLSAQATDVGVNKATRKLFQDVKAPQAMVDLGEDGLKQHIKTIGLFNAKAKNVIALSEILVRDFGGQVPADRDVLTTLPGVGRKIANLTLTETLYVAQGIVKVLLAASCDNIPGARYLWAKDRGIGGPVEGASAYFMKSPPVQHHDDIAHRMVEEFANGE